LNLEVIPKKHTSISLTICAGGVYEGYSSSGTYTDIFTSREGCDSVRVLHLAVRPTYNHFVKKSICRGENYLGHTTSGTYTDHYLTGFGCDSVQVTDLTVVDTPKPFLGRDTAICIQDTLVLQPAGADSFIWQDGSSNHQFVVRSPGIYSVTAFNHCGNATAAIKINEGPCSIYFPSAFTPNDDGKNDRFGILNARLIKDYYLVVYNRWGEIVFETRNASIGWNGKYKGSFLDTGTFVWQCSFKDDHQVRRLKGIVTLLR
jgi:gliding motility-associated-like protein